jgi:hypothetical protein
MSIELTNGSIPSYIYNIQATWGSFSLTESGRNTVTITLTPGFYTEAQLLLELEAKLNAIPGRLNSYTVTANVINGRNTRIVKVTGTTVGFIFQFYSTDFRDELDLNTLAYMAINSPARLLGFGFDDYASGNDYSQGAAIATPSSPYTLVGVLPMDLSNFLSRIYLHIEADGRNLDRMECGVGRKDCFHIFYIQNGQTDYTLLDKQTDHSIFESKPSPISRIANLEISIRDEFGRPLNLNMRELSLVFEITHLE